MSQVFVLDTNKQPLAPLHPGRARLLLTQGKAAVYRRYPFTLILKTPVMPTACPPLRVKIDPGSKTSGLALVNDASGEVVWAAELTHRGEQIKGALDKRRPARRSRRQRTTRYRAPRFKNRHKRKGTLPPSLEHGFPRTGPKQAKRLRGFQTGDLVRAVVRRGARQGNCVGKAAVRTRGSFNITTAQGTVSDIHHRWCRLIARADGYTYQQGKAAALPPTAVISRWVPVPRSLWIHRFHHVLEGMWHEINER